MGASTRIKKKDLMGLEREKGRRCLVLCLRSVGSITNVNVGSALRAGVWGELGKKNSDVKVCPTFCQ